MRCWCWKSNNSGETGLLGQNFLDSKRNIPHNGVRKNAFLTKLSPVSRRCPIRVPATGGGAFFSESGKIPTPETFDPVGQGRKCVSLAGGFPVAAARSGFGMMTAGILTVMVFFLPAPGGKSFCRQEFRPCHTETRLFATLPTLFLFGGNREHLPDDDPLVYFFAEGAVRGGNRCITENLGLKTAFPRQERALSSTRKPCGHTPGHRQFVARVRQFCRPL